MSEPTENQGLNAIQDMTFEETLKELEQIIVKLEEGGVPLEAAVHAYERGAKLKEHCEQLLKNARLKIQEIMAHKDGNISIQPSSLQALIEE